MVDWDGPSPVLQQKQRVGEGLRAIDLVEIPVLACVLFVVRQHDLGGEGEALCIHECNMKSIEV